MMGNFAKLNQAELRWLAAGITGNPSYIKLWQQMSEVSVIKAFNTLVSYPGEPHNALKEINRAISRHKPVPVTQRRSMQLQR